jgi:hypothetical protein
MCCPTEVDRRAAKSGWVSSSLANHNEPPGFFISVPQRLRPAKLDESLQRKMGHLQRSALCFQVTCGL